MKKKYYLTLFSVFLLLTGCSAQETAAQEGKMVNVTSVEDMEYDTGLNYLGIVKAKDTKNYSFLSGGKLEKVYVREGDRVTAGTPLAKLDTASLEISINTAKTNVNSLNTSVATAKSALDAMAVLHANGDISDKEWESQSSQFVTLKGNYDIAVDTLKQAEKNLKESTIYAEEEGYVMEVPYKAGEVIGAGYPAAVLKSNTKVVSIGVSVDDISFLSPETRVMIDTSINGTVDSIGQYPDEDTRAYPVDISFLSEKYSIGDMVDVQVVTGKKRGCFVPVQSIFSIDGLDYVYIVDEDGKVVRKQITRGELREDMVRADGIEAGMNVINDGIKNIKENETVVIAETEAEKEDGAS